MALKSIAADIQQIIKDSEKARTQQYKQAKIRFIFNKQYTIETVVELILNGYGNTPAVKKSLVGKGGLKFTSTERKNLTSVVTRAYKKVFTVARVTKEHQSLGYAVYKTQKEALANANKKVGDARIYAVAIYPSNPNITAVYFSSFYGNRKAAIQAKQMYGGGRGDVQNIVIRNLMNDLIDESIELMTTGFMKRIPFGLGGSKPVVSAGTLRSSMPREGSFRRRVHGEPMGNQTGGSDTTVASVNLIETLQKDGTSIMKRAQQAALKQTGQFALVSKLYEEMVEGITAGLVIKRKRMSDTIKHKDEVEIVITLANDDVNKFQNTRADKLPLERARKRIEKDMLKKLSSPGYRASEPVDKRLIQTASRSIIQGMFKQKTRPDMRLKVNKRLVREGKKQNLSETFKTSLALLKGQSVVKGRKGAKAKRSSGKGAATSRVTEKAGANPMALRNLINEMLPQAVARNMTEPALQYRTGRFANSVQVDNITQGPRGGNTMIEASYMNNPYETFAPGGKMHTPQRDPEKLIRKSVREVASGLIGAKFGISIQ